MTMILVDNIGNLILANRDRIRDKIGLYINRKKQVIGVNRATVRVKNE